MKKVAVLVVCAVCVFAAAAGGQQVKAQSQPVNRQVIQEVEKPPPVFVGQLPVIQRERTPVVRERTVKVTPCGYDKFGNRRW